MGGGGAVLQMKNGNEVSRNLHQGIQPKSLEDSDFIVLDDVQTLD